MIIAGTGYLPGVDPVASVSLDQSRGKWGASWVVRNIYPEMTALTLVAESAGLARVTKKSACL